MNGVAFALAIAMGFGLASVVWCIVVPIIVARARSREHKDAWAAANRWHAYVAAIEHGKAPTRRI